jgi:integrase
MVMLMLLRRMNPARTGVPEKEQFRWRDGRTNLPITAHGFRSTFRDWAGETTGHPRDVVEAALAHVIAGKTEAAYARGDLFAKRTRLIEEWANYCGAGDHAAGREPMEVNATKSLRQGSVPFS